MLNTFFQNVEIHQKLKKLMYFEDVPNTTWNEHYKLLSISDKASYPDELMIMWNKKNFTKVFPKSGIFHSINLDPQPFWNIGCQFVSKF